MVIVIVDSGLADRYTDCNKFVFPPCAVDNIPPIVSGHSTAIFNIINSKCSKFAEIINFRILHIENNIEDDILIEALTYIDENIHPDIVNLSLGISECNNLQALYNICLQLTSKGTIIVSAFDNSGSVSYPAAFQNVIGVVSGLLCNKTDDFEFFEDAIVNIGAKGKMQRVVWNDPPYAFLSGNSFACAHVTSKIAEMIFLSEKKLTRETILDKFRQLAIEKHSALNTFIPQKLPFDIQNAAIFPFSKEMHSLLRYEHLLDFEIVDIYDTKYSAKVGSTSTHLMNDDRINSYTIKNINEINYDSFDTFIMGHMSELSMALKNENFVVDLVNNLLQHGKNIFSFDDITYYGFCAGNNIYFPSITRKDLPPTRLGMLHRIPKPVVGVFGTSSKQGKFTLQLKLKELLLNKGYKVGAIGSEPTSQLYGMEYVFPMGYDSTVYIQGNDVISYLNSAMHDISFKEKDIIIVGSQSGTIPYDYGNISQFPVFQYSFLLGTLPDCIVLCVNLFDSFEYIHRTILFLEASANSKVIALAVIPFVIRENGNNTFDISKELMSSKDFRTIQESFNSEFNIPLYNITSDDDAIELTQQIIDFFS